MKNKLLLPIIGGIIFIASIIAFISFAHSFIYELKEGNLDEKGLIVFPLVLLLFISSAYYVYATKFGRQLKSSVDQMKEEKEKLKELIEIEELKKKLETVK
ncbi:hypothetical protein [Spongiimicrobium salis]|uniref:hypothetical protein n=1 Tax=Spongiimicrobium salis TaxID=1667022 RepID=UPI00374CB955